MRIPGRYGGGTSSGPGGGMAGPGQDGLMEGLLAGQHAAAKSAKEREEAFHEEQAAFGKDPKVYEQAFNIGEDVAREREALEEKLLARQERSPEQEALIRALKYRAAGGDTVAQQQLREGLERAQRMQMAIARSTRGLTPGQAARMGAGGAAAVRQAGAGQLEALKAREMAEGQQALAGALLAEQGQLDQMTKFYTAAGLTEFEAKQRAMQDLQRLKAKYSQAEQEQLAQIEMARKMADEDGMDPLSVALGVGGAAVGGYISGSPAGAMAGYQAGSSIGRAAGG